MKKHLKRLAFAATLAALLASTLHAATLSPATDDLAVHVASLILPPCATEDANGCIWHADARGNGQGRAFVALPDGTVLYFD